MDTVTAARMFDQAYVDGRFVTPHGSQVIDLVNPTRNEVIGKVTLADEIDTRSAVAAPAIAAGCTVVVKPSEMSAMQTQVLMEAFHEAGLPAGVVNFVTGLGEIVGAELTRSPDVAKIAFTGSTPIGKLVAKSSLDTMKRFTLELGGKSANIILDDADFSKAIP